MIWCVEDDAGIREMEIYTLNSTGFEAKGFEDGDAMFHALKTEKPDLIILDIMLPKTDGVEILNILKDSDETSAIPVIMATARGMEYEKVQSLDMGADDYLVKPFGMMEMVSRVRAVLRRCNPHMGTKPTLRAAGITLNQNERTATVDGESVQLTYKEFEILKLLISAPGKVFTRDDIFREIWGIDYAGESRTVDMHIRTIRQKLGKYGDMVQTVRNVGYRLERRGNDEKNI